MCTSKHYLLATIPAFVLATTNGWYFQRRFVFGTASHAGHSYLKFMAIQTIYYFVNLPLLALLVRLGLKPLAAQVVLSVVIAAVTYVVHDKFTFRAKQL